MFRDAGVNNLLYGTEMEERDSAKFIAVVQDVVKRRSRKDEREH